MGFDVIDDDSDVDDPDPEILNDLLDIDNDFYDENYDSDNDNDNVIDYIENNLNEIGEGDEKDEILMLINNKYQKYFHQF